MPSLDLEALLTPIAGDDPAGLPVPYMVRTQLEDARKGTETADSEAGESASAERRVDWAAMARLTQEILRASSKDLLVAAQLTEAVTCRDGAAGLAEGLELLRRLLDEAWDRLHPIVDDGDLEVRAAAFNWLAEPDRGARFPATLRMLPLFQGSKGCASWLDWTRAHEGRGDASLDALEQVVAQATRHDVFRVVVDLRSAAEQCKALIETLGQRLGDAAPSMQGLAEAIDDCLRLAEHVLTRKGGPPGDESPAATDVSVNAELDGASRAEPRGGPGQASAGDIQRAVLARADVYRRLDEATRELQTLEPHSPVPFVIRKAISWGGLSFPELLQAMNQQEGLMNLLCNAAGSSEYEHSDDD